MECSEQIIEKHFHKIDGKKVKVARAEKGWTLTKLAAESGVTRKTIGEIEKGNKKRIRKSTIKQIAITLGKPIDYFCTRIEKR
jgi:transcriptional regulator with XRE-family HTH domain